MSVCRYCDSRDSADKFGRCVNCGGAVPEDAPAPVLQTPDRYVFDANQLSMSPCGLTFSSSTRAMPAPMPMSVSPCYNGVVISAPSVEYKSLDDSINRAWRTEPRSRSRRMSRVAYLTVVVLPLVLVSGVAGMGAVGAIGFGMASAGWLCGGSVVAFLLAMVAIIFAPSPEREEWP